MGTDWLIRWSTATVVVGVAAVAAIVSYQHAYELVTQHGETGATARMVPLTVDGLVYASSMVTLHAARHERPIPPLARWLLASGVSATLGANIAHGAGNGTVGAIVAAWPAVSLVGSYELLMSIIRTGVQTNAPENNTQHNAKDTYATTPPNPAIAHARPEQKNTEEYTHEYTQDNETTPEDSSNPDDELFPTAQKIASDYWNTHGHWIPREDLRKRLRCSTKRASKLLRQLKALPPDQSPG